MRFVSEVYFFINELVLYIHVLLPSTLSSLSLFGITQPLLSGLYSRFPDLMASEYSLMLRYSGFLYQVNQVGQYIFIAKFQVGDGADGRFGRRMTSCEKGYYAG